MIVVDNASSVKQNIILQKKKHVQVVKLVAFIFTKILQTTFSFQINMV